MSITVEKCLQAWTNSLKQMNAKADIVFFGDSLTYYGDFSSVFPDKVVCNLGLRGDTLQGMIDRVDQVKLLEPKIVFLMAGINDVAILSTSLFRNKYKELVISIKQKVNNSKLIIQSILPVNSNKYTISCCNEQIFGCNKQIEYLCAELKLQYLNLYDVYIENNVTYDGTIDGIHLKSESYKFWYRCLMK